MPNKYAQFVQDHIHEFSHLPPKERMKECAKMYHEHNGTVAKPKKVAVKKVSMKKDIVVQDKGGSFLGDILPFGHLLGLGLDTKKKAPVKKAPAKKAPVKRAKKQPNMAHGGNFFEDFADGFTKPFEAIAHVVPLISHLI